MAIEVDGKRQYAQEGRASRSPYSESEMVAGGRRVRLVGYAGRVGRYELTRKQYSAVMVQDFSDRTKVRPLHTPIQRCRSRPLGDTTVAAMLD